jgi:VanZ family protein
LNSAAQRFLRYWVPAVLYTLVVLWASGDFFSAQRTGALLYRILSAIWGPISPERFAVIHHLVRKAGHVAAYAVMSYVWFRAARHRSRREHLWDWRWALVGLLAAVVIASVDEFRQSFYVSRTGSPWDVVLDGSAALFMQLLIYRVYMWRTRRRAPAPAAD